MTKCDKTHKSFVWVCNCSMPSPQQAVECTSHPSEPTIHSPTQSGHKTSPVCPGLDKVVEYTTQSCHCCTALHQTSTSVQTKHFVLDWLLWAYLLLPMFSNASVNWYLWLSFDRSIWKHYHHYPHQQQATPDLFWCSYSPMPPFVSCQWPNGNWI